MPLFQCKSIMPGKQGNPKNNIRGVGSQTKPGIGIIVNDGGGACNTSGTDVREEPVHRFV